MNIPSDSTGLLFACFTQRFLIPLLGHYISINQTLKTTTGNHWIVTEAFWRSSQVLSWSTNSPHFMEPEGSLPHLQQPATCPDLQPD